MSVTCEECGMALANHTLGERAYCDEVQQLRRDNQMTHDLNKILYGDVGRLNALLVASDHSWAALRAENGRLREDKARWDWVESNVCKMTCRRADGSEYELEWESNGPDADTARSAVDAADTAGAARVLRGGSFAL